VSIERPVLQVTPGLLSGHSATYDDGVQNTLRCARVQVYSISRLNLLSYASSFHISVAPSAAISERLHSQIHVCLHRDESLGLCECQKDEWKSVQKGIWSYVMSLLKKIFRIGPLSLFYLDWHCCSLQLLSVGFHFAIAVHWLQ
ncbi:hypothetical protein PIB30_024594, partial [Stylosanthes scabra]|nr:hypothetical protein [Stylosanthes scabra]